RASRDKRRSAAFPRAEGARARANQAEIIGDSPATTFLWIEKQKEKQSMKFQKLERNTFALIFDKGDEFISVLTSFAKEKDLGGSHFTAIGAFRIVMLGYFDRDKKDYKKIRSKSKSKSYRLSATSP